MRIFPAVDILGGQCVQLVQGRRESATAFGDPLSCATRWLDQGADALHVVNLDGAFGNSGKNAGLITDLASHAEKTALVNGMPFQPIKEHHAAYLPLIDRYIRLEQILNQFYSA